MKNVFSLFTVTACLVMAPVALHAADKSSVSAADKSFAMKAAVGGMTEVQLGKLASEKASSPEVKDFGSKMVTDHGKAGEELKTIATGKGITLPDKLDAKHQAMVDKMSKLSGTAFDKQYVTAMVKAHKEDDAAFSKEAKSGGDADFKAFAVKTDEEVIKMHMKMIEDIESKMK